MRTFFDDRERAAEYGFAHGEELRFLEMRTGVEALGLWAADTIGADDPSAYAASLVADMMTGSGEAGIRARVREDLTRAGKTDALARADSVYARAVAEAHDRLHGIVHGHSDAPATPVAAAAPAEHHRSAFWGWEV